MKKYITLALMFILIVSMVIPSSAAAKIVSKDLKMLLELPADFAKAKPGEFEDYYEGDGETSSTSGEFAYIYLKKKVDNPHVKISFEVSEDGIYDFCFAVMASSSSSTSIPRTGLLQIDDSEKVYIKSIHEDRNGIFEYFVGMSANLSKGKHDLNVYLADDFDDSTVKSLFFDKFYFVKSKTVVVETVETPKTETTTKAPATMDVTLVAAGIAALSAAAVAVLKKRK